MDFARWVERHHAVEVDFDASTHEQTRLKDENDTMNQLRYRTNLELVVVALLAHCRRERRRTSWVDRRLRKVQERRVGNRVVRETSTCVRIIVDGQPSHWIA